VRPVILDVGGGTGAWSEPYRKALYDVRIIDPVTWPFTNAFRARFDMNCDRVHGILLAPPCTEFAVSGARWWASKPPELLEKATVVVRDMLALVECFKPAWWALENPVGRIAKCVPELGKHRYTWHPYHYGDPEVKLTCMWGDHVEPVRTPIEGPYTARVHRMAPGPNRAALRSITPSGFARAFFEANP
jgi:hypothetical protein